MMLCALPDKVSPPIETLRAVSVAESSKGDYYHVTAAPSGEWFFVNDRRLFLNDRAGTVDLRLPAPSDHCVPIGVKGSELMVDVNLDGGHVVYAVPRSGRPRVATSVGPVIATGVSGDSIAGTDYGVRVSKAYSWRKSWRSLPDLGRGAETRAVGDDGRTFGLVNKERQTLPCYWDKAGALHTLRMPGRLDNGVANKNCGHYIFGYVGLVSERTGDIEHYRQSVVWRDGSLANPYEAFLKAQNDRFFDLRYAKDGYLYGNYYCRSKPTTTCGTCLSEHGAYTLTAMYRGKTYFVDSVVGGFKDRILCTGHLISKSPRYVSALILCRSLN